MRRCYEELGRPAGAPLATLKEAFKPHSLVVFEEEHRGRSPTAPISAPPGPRPTSPSP